MIEELISALPDFAGETNRTRCFLHIINLVAKTLLKQFDVPNKKGPDGELSEADQALEEMLQSLAEGIDLEELTTVAEKGAGDENNDENDDIEGWEDEVEKLSDEDRNSLLNSIWPLRLVLVKVRKMT